MKIKHFLPILLSFCEGQETVSMELFARFNSVTKGQEWRCFCRILCSKQKEKEMKMKKNFSIKTDTVLPGRMTTNAAGGNAYSRTAEETLAQYAVTGVLNGTIMASPNDANIANLQKLALQCSTRFLAQLAIYSRESAYMKDMPAFFLAVLMTRDSELFKRVFNRVVNNGKMLRTFCGVVRSGAVGRKSFGSAARGAIRNWLAVRSDERLFEDAIGNNPSLADVIKMVHPKPSTQARRALYAYLIGKEYKAEDLPQVVKDYEDFRTGNSNAIPNTSFMRLSNLPLSTENWMTIAENANWHTLRMNLATFGRHGVYANTELVSKLANRLGNPELVRRAGAFPYQLFAAYKMAGDTTPEPLVEALNRAMEAATASVPYFDGKVHVAVDYSGSMIAPVTGTNAVTGRASAVTCNMVGALIASCVVRNSDNASVYRFDTKCQDVKLDPGNSILTNASKIAANGGGTDCSAPVRLLNDRNATGDTVIIISDNESWSGPQWRSETGLMKEWNLYKARNPNAKLILVDLASSGNSQAATRPDVLNVGGWSDAVFVAIHDFLKTDGVSGFLHQIEGIDLEDK